MNEIVDILMQRKLTTGSRILRQSINKGLNRALAKAFKLRDTSVVVWKGTSRLDGQTPIMVTMSGYTRDSENAKTGGMIQVAILPVHVKPIDCYKEGSPAVCGDCKYNGNNGCYVSWANLGSHWNGTRNQTPIDMSLASEICRGLEVRVGSAGDPTAVPLEVWEKLLEHSHGFTSYTHQWRRDDMQEFKKLCMASVDCEEEREAAIKRGWNTFLVYDEEEPQFGVRCLASSGVKDRNGLDYQCISCMACSGKGSKHIVEKLHGATNTLHAARRVRI